MLFKVISECLRDQFDSQEITRKCSRPRMAIAANDFARPASVQSRTHLCRDHFTRTYRSLHGAGAQLVNAAQRWLIKRGHQFGSDAPGIALCVLQLEALDQSLVEIATCHVFSRNRALQRFLIEHTTSALGKPQRRIELLWMFFRKGSDWLEFW